MAGDITDRAQKKAENILETILFRHNWGVEVRDAIADALVAFYRTELNSKREPKNGN